VNFKEDFDLKIGFWFGEKQGRFFVFLSFKRLMA